MVNHRVNRSDFLMIISFAVFADILSIVLTITGVGAIADLIITVIVYALIIIFFRLKGVKVFSVSTIKRIQESKSSKSGRGRMAKKVWSMIGELIPFVDIIIPGYTLFTYYTYKDAVDEDEAKAKSSEQIKGGSYVNKIRNARRGSVEGSQGNRIESRRDKRVNQAPKKQGDQEEGDNTLAFRQKRSNVKYEYGQGKGRKAA